MILLYKLVNQFSSVNPFLDSINFKLQQTKNKEQRTNALLTIRKHIIEEFYIIIFYNFTTYLIFSLVFWLFKLVIY